MMGWMSFADTVVLFVLALLLFGPKKLPGIARQIGKALNEFKRASNEFKAQIESEISQLEYQERQQKREEEQKILPPQPPEGSIASSRYSGLPEHAQPSPPASEVDSAAHNTTNA
jgi:sec-independent protein translocase protein TatB